MNSLVDIPLAPYLMWPYAVGLAAAICFGIIGFKMGQTWLPFVIGGGVFGLVTATVASGVANAVAVPYTDAVRNRYQLASLAVALVIIAVAGFLLTFQRDYSMRRTARTSGAKQSDQSQKQGETR